MQQIFILFLKVYLYTYILMVLKNTMFFLSVVSSKMNLQGPYLAEIQEHRKQLKSSTLRFSRCRVRFPGCEDSQEMSLIYSLKFYFFHVIYCFGLILFLLYFHVYFCHFQSFFLSVSSFLFGSHSTSEMQIQRKRKQSSQIETQEERNM